MYWEKKGIQGGNVTLIFYRYFLLDFLHLPDLLYNLNTGVKKYKFTKCLYQ